MQNTPQAVGRRLGKHTTFATTSAVSVAHQGTLFVPGRNAIGPACVTLHSKSNLGKGSVNSRDFFVGYGHFEIGTTASF
ncbi:MAG: hypothetical protein ACJAZO_004401 [Myxococcota bacterium]|jgi:hypothetical protein